MDVRLRTMQDLSEKTVGATAGGRRANTLVSLNARNTAQPGGRRDMVNTRVHGGNLRDDAVMVKLNHFQTSHGNLHVPYRNYISQIFGQVYGGLSPDNACWLGKILSSHSKVTHLLIPTLQQDKTKRMTA